MRARRKGPSAEGRRLAAQAERMESDLRAIRRSIQKPLEAEVARGELTAPQIAVMSTVVREQGIPLRDLSRAVSLAHSTVSGIVDRLEQRDIIVRRVDETDKRVTRIYPTAAVTQFVREEIPALARRPLEAALMRADGGERAGLEAALRRLRELLEAGEE
jgi:DNA-binding MarR family transcriptional regulator